MYFNQRIGRQLGGGFGLVLVITLSVVAFGCIAMWHALGSAHEMKDRDLPAVTTAQAIELHILQTMYAIRTWSYTHDKKHLQDGRGHIATLRDDILPAAAELAEREHLPILKESVKTATKDVVRYAELVDQTERALANHDRLVQVRLDTAEAALKEAIAFKKDQIAFLQEEIVGNKGAQETGRTIARIEQVTAIIERIYAIRVAILIAQSSGDVSHIAEVNRLFDTVAGHIKDLLADTRRQDNKDRLSRMAAAMELYHRAAKEWAHDVEAMAKLGKERQSVAEEALAAAATAAKANLAKAAAEADATAREMTLSTKVLVGGLVAAIALGSALAWFLARSIANPVREASTALARLANGDFRTGMATRRQDELGDMARSVDATVKALRTAMHTIQQTAQRVGGHATAIAGAADQVASASEETTHQVTTVATSTEEISTSMNTVSAATQEMSSSIDHISQHANEVTGMAGDANARAQTAAKEMETLQGASERISGAVKLIARIAEQTNLLALNAAIEAASAGEAGRGFAVVASEVKALAQQTSEATNQISAMVQDIQTSAATSQQTIGTFLALVQKITQLQQSVAAAVEQQTATTKEITGNVQEAATGVRLITENMVGVQTSAETSTTAAAAARQAVRDLTGAAEELRRIVSQFQLE